MWAGTFTKIRNNGATGLRSMDRSDRLIEREREKTQSMGALPALHRSPCRRAYSPGHSPGPWPLLSASRERSTPSCQYSLKKKTSSCALAGRKHPTGSPWKGMFLALFSREAGFEGCFDFMPQEATQLQMEPQQILRMWPACLANRSSSVRHSTACVCWALGGSWEYTAPCAVTGVFSAS